MWALDNHTPYGAERSWIRDKHGRHFWVVAVKATFDVRPNGEVVLADEQPPPLLAPEYTGEPGRSSLRYDSDLLYAKPCTDVLADAHAHAPLGQPRDVVSVSMRVGPIHKELRVHGNRVYNQGVTGITTTSPIPFASRPITYEWAFGGSDLSDPDPAKHRIDDRNPIGKGFAVNPSHLVRRPAHAIEYPSGNPAKLGPAGFGPIDPAWSPRRERAGTYDAEWARSRRPLLPDDYQELYGSSAPDDQRVAPHLRGGEPVELEGMSPRGTLRFELPKVYPTYTTKIRSRREEHRGRLATVLLLPEVVQVALVFQTTLPVGPRDVDYLDETRISEKRYL